MKKPKEPEWSSVPEYLEWRRLRRRKFLKRALIVFILLKVFAIHGCYGPYKGVVLDKDTGKPVEGVVVMATYYRTFISPGGDVKGPVLDVQEAMTDDDGEFLLWPKNVWALPGLVCWFSQPEINFIKPHYLLEHYYSAWQSYYSWVPMSVQIIKTQEDDLKSVESALWSLFETETPSRILENKIPNFVNALKKERVRIYGIRQSIKLK